MCYGPPPTSLIQQINQESNNKSEGAKQSIAKKGEDDLSKASNPEKQEKEIKTKKDDKIPKKSEGKKTTKKSNKIAQGLAEPRKIYKGSPRKEDVKTSFENNEKSSQDLISKKHAKYLKQGYSSLIGKIANDVVDCIGGGKKSYKLNIQNVIDATFKKVNKQDISTNFGSYENIISSMIENEECTKEVALQMLTNLSKNNERKDEELFENLGKNAKKLITVLICESIRFQDDGALSRMAIRLAINLFSQSKNSEYDEENPFSKVFTGDSPLSIFSIKGGKQRMLNLIKGYKSEGDKFYEKDLEQFEKNKNFISEEDSSYDQHKDVNSRKTLTNMNLREKINAPTRFKDEFGY